MVGSKEVDQNPYRKLLLQMPGIWDSERQYSLCQDLPNLGWQTAIITLHVMAGGASCDRMSPCVRTSVLLDGCVVLSSFSPSSPISICVMQLVLEKKNEKPQNILGAIQQRQFKILLISTTGVRENLNIVLTKLCLTNPPSSFANNIMKPTNSQDSFVEIS